VTPHFVESKNVVVIIIVRNDVRDQGNMTDASQHRCGKKSSIEAMSLSLA
jgi:hypothetical protein